MITLKNITKNYSKDTVLDIKSLEIPAANKASAFTWKFKLFRNFRVEI